MTRRSRPRITPAMRNRGTWIAFLLACFALTFLVGLFGTYASSIPLERALYRTTTLDEATATDPPDRERLRTVIGPAADQLLDGPGPIAPRLAAARAQIRSEGEREEASVATRARLMLGVVSLLAAGLGAGILLIATRGR